MAYQRVKIGSQNSNFEWKSLTYASGTTAINLPSSFKELLFNVRVDNNDLVNYTFSVTREYLARANGSTKGFRNGYYGSATSSGFVYVQATTSTIHIQEAWQTGQNVTGTSQLWVWYR